ncbi:MFS transporter [uncultured Williamsia sp.]|uniref:MFS transporter n=1 Tax=uncultured Williamsia sp. TaxID=259311 RepID=UPI00262540E2|nr:MFS transporter [uncultured Williamsia sp.]
MTAPTAPAPTWTVRRIWLTVVSSLGLTLVMSSMVALNTALPDMAVDLSATQTQLTWIIDGYTLVLACLLLPAGALGDRFGRRGALIGGLVVVTLASVIPLVVDGPTAIIVSRALAGVGAAFVMPATLSLLTTAFSDADRVKAVGVWAGAAGSGAVVGFLGSGILLRYFEWPSIFVAFVVAGALLAVLACTVTSSREEVAAPFDVVGAVLSAAAIAVFVFGVLEAPHRGWSDPLVWASMVAGVVLAAAFTVVELRREHPLLDMHLFRRADFATGAFVVTVVFMTNFGLFFVVIQQYQLMLGYSPLRSAFALMPMVVPIVLLSVCTHWFLPRLGLRIVGTLGCLLTGVGLICHRTISAQSGYWATTWPLIAVAAGVGLCAAACTLAISAATPREKQGVASAVNDVTREMGAAIGIALSGSILAAGYTHALVDRLGGAPEQVVDAARQSLAAALTVAQRLGPQGAPVESAARDAFISGMHDSMTVLGIVAIVGGLLVVVWSPGRDNRQFRWIRVALARHRGHDPRAVRAAWSAPMSTRAVGEGMDTIPR